MLKLKGLKVINTAINLPGPLAAARLRDLGADVIKIEPPAGDPLAEHFPKWYGELTRGQKIIKLDLKNGKDVKSILETGDVLITALRLSSLRRLKLDWKSIHHTFPALCQVAILGYCAPDEEKPGHDLLYQASSGLVTPPTLPRSLFSDIMGGEQAASDALGLLLARERSLKHQGGFAKVALSGAASALAAPIRHGATLPGALLGGGFPGYRFYRTKSGWIALAAIESSFQSILMRALRLKSFSASSLQKCFKSKTAVEWERWATANGIPLVALKPSG